MRPSCTDYNIPKAAMIKHQKKPELPRYQSSKQFHNLIISSLTTSSLSSVTTAEHRRISCICDHCTLQNNCQLFGNWRSCSNTYMIGANDGASPRPHEQVITIIHSVAHSAISNSFFSPLKLFQQSEVSWNCTRPTTKRASRGGKKSL